MLVSTFLTLAFSCAVVIASKLASDEQLKLKSKESAVPLDDLESVLDTENAGVISLLLGQRHQVHIPEALVAHICLRQWLQPNFDQTLLKYREQCPNSDTEDVDITCFLGHLAVHDFDIFSKDKDLQQMISHCHIWWKTISERSNSMSSRKISEIGRCLSKLVSKSCEVEAFIKSALKT